MIFELIVVDTKAEAKSYVIIGTESDKTYVTFVGEGLCGLQHRGQRPNKLTRLHSPLTSDYEKRWETEVLIPTMAKGERRGMSGKVGLTRKQAEAMDAMLAKYTVDEILNSIVNRHKIEYIEGLRGAFTIDVIKAILLGYEVTKTSQEHL